MLVNKKWISKKKYLETLKELDTYKRMVSSPFENNRTYNSKKKSINKINIKAFCEMFPIEQKEYETFIKSNKEELENGADNALYKTLEPYIKYDYNMNEDSIRCSAYLNIIEE